MEYKDPGRYIPIIYLLYSWGSLFGVPSRVPLKKGTISLTTTLNEESALSPLRAEPGLRLAALRRTLPWACVNNQGIVPLSR